MIRLGEVNGKSYVMHTDKGNVIFGELKQHPKGHENEGQNYIDQNSKKWPGTYEGAVNCFLKIKEHNEMGDINDDIPLEEFIEVLHESNYIREKLLKKMDRK